jgi:hypothetical protein
MFLGPGGGFLGQRRRGMCRGSKLEIGGRRRFGVGRESNPFFHLCKLVMVVLKFLGWIDQGYHFDVDLRGYEMIVGGIGFGFVGRYGVFVEVLVMIVGKSLRRNLGGLCELVIEFVKSLETKPMPVVRY